MSRIVGVVASALVVVAALSGISATAASAGGGVLTLSYHDGTSQNLSCNVGSHGVTELAGQWPDKAENGCTTSVALFEDRSGQGLELCLNPESGTGMLDRNWRSYLIESVQNHC